MRLARHENTKTRASRADVSRLKVLVQSFVRDFGLLVTRQTPCGLPISPSHAHGLMVLLERERTSLGTSQSDLGEKLSIDKSNIARLCAKLQQAGHATQAPAPNDGRGRTVSLTAKGKRLAERLEEVSDQRFLQILRAVSADEREAMLGSLETLVRAVRELEPPPGASE